MTTTIHAVRRANEPFTRMHQSAATTGIRRIARGFALSALAAAALMAAGLGAGVARADGPGTGLQRAIVAEGQTSITTDKAAYMVGETITVTYTLPGPGQIRITDRQGSQLSTLRAGFSQQSSGTIQGTVTPPLGRECLTLEYAGGPKVLTEDPAPGRPGGLATAQTCFQVTDRAEPKDPGPCRCLGPSQHPDQPAGQAAGVYTFAGGATDLLLSSDGIGRRIIAEKADGSADQRWHLVPGPGGYVFLRNAGSLFALDGSQPGPAEREPSVHETPFTASAAQQWQLEPGTRGAVVLRNRQSGLVLQQSRGVVTLGVLRDGEQPDAQAQWRLATVQP
jgi:hypothetical protein